MWRKLECSSLLACSTVNTWIYCIGIRTYMSLLMCAPVLTCRVSA